VEFKKIIQLVTSAEHSEIIMKLTSACDQMLNDLQSGHLRSSNYLQLQFYYNSQVALLEERKLAGKTLADFAKWATRAVGSSGGGILGIVLGGEFGGVAGGLLGGGMGWWLGNKIEQIAMKDAIYRSHDPRRYRLYAIGKLSGRGGA
jgi:hypothetical protein